MKDRLFLYTDKHKNKIGTDKNASLFINEKFHANIGLESIAPKRNELTEITASIPEYTFFYKIRLEDILYLRTSFDSGNKLHQFWCKKMYSFLEFRLKTIQTRIKKNYPNKEDQVIFIQNVISFYLEQFEAQNDARFLSIAIKLLRNTSIAKYGFLNTKTADQYLYNLIVADTLITKI